MNETATHIKKAPYQKPESIKELERLADAAAHKRFPNHPPGVLAPRRYRDDTANELTKAITAYLRLKGAFVSRLNNGGVYDRRLNRYRPGTNRKGLPDILATYQGKSLFIEVKMRDRMSKDQERIREEQTASGGYWFTAHNLTEFITWFDNLNH